MSELLTTREAADMLRCHRDTLYSLWHKGEIKRTKVGSKTLWPRRELQRYIDRQTKGPR